MNCLTRIFGLVISFIILSGCQNKDIGNAAESDENIAEKSSLNSFFEKKFKAKSWRTNPSDTLLFSIEKNLEQTYLSRYNSIWFNDSGLSKNGEDLIYVLRNIQGYGLDSTLFERTTIRNLLANANSNEKKFHLELKLTREYYRLGTYLNRGYLSEDKYEPIFEIDSVEIDLSQHLRAAAENNTILESLHQLEPQLPEYRHLRQALVHFTKSYPITTNSARICTFKTDSSKCIKGAADALVDFGYLDSNSIKNDSIIICAIKLFQKHNGLNQDGKPGTNTAKAFLISNQERYLAAQATLTKLRWEKDQQRTSYIYVNIPSYTMKVADSGQYVFQKKTVVGNTWTKTPVFKAELEYFVMNPVWNVPYSISSKEILKKVKKDSTYLTRNGYVVSQKGKQLNSNSIDWQNITPNNFNYQISQNSGSGNALGKIKFIFPNTNFVYMHDTPSKHFFAKDIRAFSHGCIRLQHPVELAKYLAEKQDLSVQKDSIQSKIDTKKNRVVLLKEKIPVYIEYHLAGTDVNGEIEFYRNIYKKDLQLLAALNKNQNS